MGLEKPTGILFERIFQKAARKKNPRVKIERDAQEALARCCSCVQGLFVRIPVEEDNSKSRLLLIEEVAHLFKEADEFSKGNIWIPYP